LHPYIPADILEDRLQSMDPRIQSAIDRLVRDGQNDTIAMADDEYEVRATSLWLSLRLSLRTIETGYAVLRPQVVSQD
jgi:hypothetical protein